MNKPYKVKTTCREADFSATEYVLIAQSRPFDLFLIATHVKQRKATTMKTEWSKINIRDTNMQLCAMLCSLCAFDAASLTRCISCVALFSRHRHHQHRHHLDSGTKKRNSLPSDAVNQMEISKLIRIDFETGMCKAFWEQIWCHIYDGLNPIQK